MELIFFNGYKWQQLKRIVEIISNVCCHLCLDTQITHQSVLAILRTSILKKCFHIDYCRVFITILKNYLPKLINKY